MRLRLEEQTMRRALGASSFLTRNEGKAMSRIIGAARRAACRLRTLALRKRCKRRGGRQSTINASAYV